MRAPQQCDRALCSEPIGALEREHSTARLAPTAKARLSRSEEVQVHSPYALFRRVKRGSTEERLVQDAAQRPGIHPRGVSHRHGRERQLRWTVPKRHNQLRVGAFDIKESC